jgi:hypothetical protein
VPAVQSLVDGLLAASGYRADDLAVLQAECALEADALRSARRAARSSAGAGTEGTSGPGWTQAP